MSRRRSTLSTAGLSRSPRPPDRTLLEQWNKVPSLVHGDFEQGRQAPLGWSPLHADVTWVQETAKGGKSKNRVIRFTLNEEVAGTSGVLYYSDPFPVEKGATYRFQCRWKSTGSAAKVFIKCYDELPTDFRASSVAGRPTIEGREVYRSQQNLEGQPRGLERADRGLHTLAQPVHAALGSSDALRLLARRHGRMGRYHSQAGRTGADNDWQGREGPTAILEAQSPEQGDAEVGGPMLNNRCFMVGYISRPQYWSALVTSPPAREARRPEDLRGQRLLHEPDRAVAEQELAAAGVAAPEGIGSRARVIRRVPAGDGPAHDVG